MEFLVVIIVIAFAVGGYFSLRKSVLMEQALALSLAQKDIAPVLKQIHQLPPANRPDYFHRAIGHFWKGYERPLAADLIRIFLEEHQEAPVAHFWVQEMLNVEPALGREKLSEEDLQRDYRPELAACCGPAG